MIFAGVLLSTDLKDILRSKTFRNQYAGIIIADKFQNQ